MQQPAHQNTYDKIIAQVKKRVADTLKLADSHYNKYSMSSIDDSDDDVLFPYLYAHELIKRNPLHYCPLA